MRTPAPQRVDRRVGRSSRRPRRACVVVVAALATSLVAAPAARAAAAQMPQGTASLQSVNYPDRYVSTAGSNATALAQVSGSSSAQAKSAATLQVIQGLADPRCYSFRTSDGKVLRHRDFVVVAEFNDTSAQFRADATFCQVAGSTSGSLSLSSFNYPAMRLRHRDFGLRLDAVEDTATFRADSSFTLVAPWTPKTRKNPIIPGFNADPTITRFGDRYYLYPTSDGFAGWSSPHYTAWSSTDLVNWTPHGVVLDLRPDVTWADDSAWAPSVVAKNGRYYLYFSGGASSGNTSKQLGVAVSDSPIGPFRDARGTPLVTSGSYPGQTIDPMVYTDTDGSSYLYWGQGALNMVKLNADMISFDPAAVRTTYPAGYNEAPFLVRRNNTYYLMWSENDTRSEDYRIAYATGSSPFGPWTNRGVILSKNVSAGILGTGHHAVVQVPGTDTWYIAYHRFAVPGGDGMNREVALDRMYFKSDGTIATVVPTP